MSWFRRVRITAALLSVALTCLGLPEVTGDSAPAAAATPTASRHSTQATLAGLPLLAAQGVASATLEEESTEYSNTVLEPDGSLTTEIYSSPVNFQDEAGDWQPIDNQLIPSEAPGYALENKAADYQVSTQRRLSKSSSIREGRSLGGMADARSGRDAYLRWH